MTTVRARFVDLCGGRPHTSCRGEKAPWRGHFLIAVSLLCLTVSASVAFAGSPDTWRGGLAPLAGVQAISTGGRHSCALTSAGKPLCWGYNFYGQLGDGSVTDRLIATDVATLSGIRSVAAGGEHGCAVTSTNGVKCWGWNLSGQVGDGTTTNRFTAVDVATLSVGVQAIDGGMTSRTCALTSSGAVKCWGHNAAGQLGDGSTINRLIPVGAVGLSSNVLAIAGGQTFTCALTDAGTVKCWGVNGSGQLGDGSTVNRHTPVNVIGLSAGVQAISTGGLHTCALTDAGLTKCWGSNGNGQLGDGSFASSLVPIDVVGLPADILAIAAGGSHTCALTTGGAVKCWGNNLSGQLGDGTFTSSRTPVDVVGLDSGARAISASRSHTCALLTSGTVKCWGWNGTGQLGDNTTVNRSLPVDVLAEGGLDPIFSSGFEPR